MPNSRRSVTRSSIYNEEEATSVRVGKILKNRIFIMLALSLSAIYFLVTGVQYWISDYLQTVLLVSPEEVYYYYTASCFSAPLLGVIIGGCIVSHLGGYNSPKAFGLVTFVGFMAMAVSLPIPFLSNRYAVYVLSLIHI